MNDKKKAIYLIVGIIVIIVLAVFIIQNYFNSHTKKDSSEELNSEKSNSEELKNQIENQIKDIQNKFEVLSKEIVSEDSKTLKPDYSEEQELFNSILLQVGELDKFIESNNQSKDLTEVEYYNQLSKRTNNILELINTLDTAVHTNTDDFKATFTNLLNMFNNFKEKAVSDDNASLKDEYKQYQNEFNNIVKDILSLSSEIESNEKNQQYFDNLTEKGNELISRLKSLAEKLSISLE